MYRKYIKRIIDFILSLVAIVIFSPFLLLIVILIKLDSEGPVLFRINGSQGWVKF